MQKWEYLLFEVSLANNRVIRVNGEGPGKTGRLGLHEAAFPNLVDYLKYIGEQGWEIVGSSTSSCGTTSSPHSPSAALSGRETLT